MEVYPSDFDPFRDNGRKQSHFMHTHMYIWIFHNWSFLEIDAYKYSECHMLRCKWIWRSLLGKRTHRLSLLLWSTILFFQS